MKAILSFALIISLGGCLHIPSVPNVAGDEMITIETQPGWCFGGCERFDIRVSSNGYGILRVYRDTEVIRFRGFRVSRARYEAVKSALAPVRPAGSLEYSDPKICDSFASDLGDYRINWLGGGVAGSLIVNDGCDLKQADLAREAIDKAISTLGIKRLPAASSGVVASTIIPKR